MDRPLQRRVLRDQIKDRILERILDGTYPPGSRVIESQIAAEYGTSQAPVREALRDLEGMRLIESQPHIGARVRSVGLDELIQIYPVRAALEEVAGREAAPRMTDDELDSLAAELESMRASALAGDVHSQLSFDARFHEIIVESSGNTVLLDLWRSLRVEARTLVSVIKADSDLVMIAEMHAPILAALQLRDPDLAGKEMRSHIEYFAEVVRRIDGGQTPAKPVARSVRRRQDEEDAG